MPFVGSLFHSAHSQTPPAASPTPTAHPQKPFHPSHSPIGTNKWYTQFLLDRNTDPIYPLPYAVALLDAHSTLSQTSREASGAGGFLGLGILHSPPSQIVFGPAVCPEPDSSVRYYYNPVEVSICLGARELDRSNLVPEISGWSEFTLQLKLSCPHTRPRGSSSISFPIARGSAFVTALYTDLTPTLASVHAVIQLDCLNSGQEHCLFGLRKHRLIYNDGSTWLIYSLPRQSHSHLELQKINSSQIHHLRSWSGLIQLVKMSDHYQRNLGENSHREHEESIYDNGVGVWITTVTLRSGPIGSGEYSFDWGTTGPRSDWAKPLLFALPHHIEALSDHKIVVKPEIIIHSRVAGPMRLCCAATWSLTENVAGLSHYGIQPYHLPNQPPLYDPLKLGLLRQVMTMELETDFVAESDLDSYYFSGKKLAKQALQCLTASCILKDASLSAKYVEKTKQSFLRFCQNRCRAAPLVYERTWKGIISSAILRSGNRNEDFGNGIYNDHHFHFGYFVYAAAVLVYHDPSFLSLVGGYVEDLIRDTNNADERDPYFPPFRNFDWFLGHSLATGLDSSMDGKNQESCSEDANFLYAIKVWAEVTHNGPLQALADLQLSLLKRSINHYYYMTESNTNAPTLFRGNRVAGILFENKADYTTFFSNEKDAIHMIQVIPITPITPFLRSPEFVWQEWTNTGSPREKTNQVCQIATKLANGYQTLLLTQYGIVDPCYVFNIFANRLGTGQEIPLDDGISLAWIFGFLIHQSALKLQDFSSPSR